VNAGKRCELVLGRWPVIDDFKDTNTAHGERVCHERTVAAPRYGLGAHERGRARFGPFDRARKSLFEGGRLHVVSKAAKAWVAPAEIDRIGSCMTQPAQLFQVDITNVRGAKRRRECQGVKLRVVSRSRDRADVEDLPDGIRFKQCEKAIDGTGGMTNRKDGQSGLGAISAEGSRKDLPIDLCYRHRPENYTARRRTPSSRRFRFCRTYPMRIMDPAVLLLLGKDGGIPPFSRARSECAGCPRRS